MHLEPDEEHEILNELQAHVEDHVQELMASGVPSDEAIDSALKNLGATNEIAAPPALCLNKTTQSREHSDSPRYCESIAK